LQFYPTFTLENNEQYRRAVVVGSNFSTGPWIWTACGVGERVSLESPGGFVAFRYKVERWVFFWNFEIFPKIDSELTTF
jgi:hypothetical protein